MPISFLSIKKEVRLRASPAETTQIADLGDAAMLRKAIVLGFAVAALSGTGACAQLPAKASNEYNGGPLLQPFGQDVQGEVSSRALGGFKGGPMSGLHTYRVIKIESDPPGALVWIDGRRFGTTPQAIRVDDQRPTIHVVVKKPGYFDKVGELDLTDLPEQVTVIHEDLMPRQ